MIWEAGTDTLVVLSGACISYSLLVTCIQFLTSPSKIKPTAEIVTFRFLKGKFNFT